MRWESNLEEMEQDTERREIREAIEGSSITDYAKMSNEELEDVLKEIDYEIGLFQDLCEAGESIYDALVISKERFDKIMCIINRKKRKRRI